MREAFIFLAVLSAATIPGDGRAQSHDLIGYWHNWSDANAPYIPLDQVDPRYSVIEVAFALPANGSTSNMQFVPAMVSQSTLITQIQTLQAAGRKVLISIGGATATVQLNSNAQRDVFVSSMLTILNTFGFDGIDLDLEGSSVSITSGTIAAPIDQPIIRLIAAVNSIATQYQASHGHHMMLTMAPETAFVQGGMSAFGGIWGAYLPIIHALRDRLDILQVQLYNSGSMYGINGAIYEQGTADFILSQTEAVIQGFNTLGGYFNGLPPEKVASALPACPSAAGGGYVSSAVLVSAMNYLLGTGPQPGNYTRTASYPALRGLMTWSVNWDALNTCNTTSYRYAQTYQSIFGTSLPVRVRAMLDGPYDPILHLMHDSLRVHSYIPTLEPFTAAGFTQVAANTGQVPASGVLNFSGNNAIVDWVLLELRSALAPSQILQTRTALIQRDGDIVALDGTSPVTFSGVAGSYRIAARQRNHLGVMTATSVMLSTSILNIDLTNGSTATYGTNALKNVNGTMVMWAGNTARDVLIKYTGSANDRDPILVRIGGTIPTNTVSGYFAEDVNMDAKVKYTGAANDRDPVLVNIGGTVPTNTLSEQLP